MFSSSPAFLKAKLGCAILVLMALLSCSVTKTDAQITASVYNGFGDFAYDVQSMPDLDQRRMNLPNDGSMYCVPTACMNLCAFAANFGFPGLPPGPGLWEGVPGHDDMTTYLFFMGAYMGTDPDDGTGGTGKINGMNNWIIDAGQPLCVVSAYPDDSGYWPTIDHASIHGASGAIVQISYGRYEWQQVAGRPWLTDRTGGHAVTLKLAFANTGNIYGDRLIHYRDPGTHEGNLNSNSDFDSVWPNTAGNIDVGTSIYGANLDYVATSLLNPPPNNDNRLRLMDSYLALYPGGGLAYDDVEVNPLFVTGTNGFTTEQPSPFNTSQIQADQILSVIPHPLNHSSLVLVSVPNDTPQLYQSHNGGRFHHVTSMPEGTKYLTPGFGLTIYAGVESQVQTEMVAMELTGLNSWSFPLPSEADGIDALVYDEVSNLVVIASGQRMFTVNPDTGQISGFKNRGLPNGRNPIKTLSMWNGQICVATEDGKVAMAFLNGFVPDTMLFRDIPLPSVNHAEAVDFDSQGRMYVSDRDDGLLEYIFDQGSWTRATNPYFQTVDLRGQRFIPFKNRTNIRPGDLRPSQWYNVDPDELESLGPNVPD